jgi:hypothetical protein
MNGDIHRFYWKRAHRDWDLRVGVILMLAAMLIYLMRGDLRWPVQAEPKQAISGMIGN